MRSTTKILLMVGTLFIGTTTSASGGYSNDVDHDSNEILEDVARSGFEQKNEAMMLVTVEGDVHVYNYIPGLIYLYRSYSIYSTGILIIRSEKEDHPKIFAAPLQ